MADVSTFVVRAPSVAVTASTTNPHFIVGAVTRTIQVVHIDVTQETNVTSAMAVLELIRSTANPSTAATGTAIVAAVNANDAAAAVTGFTTCTGSISGTQTTLWRSAFNVLNGFQGVPIPQEMIRLAAGQFLWLRLPIAPGSLNYNFNVTVSEI